MSFNLSKQPDLTAPEIASSDTRPDVPHSPLPTTRWECPARYIINHRHQDGRPLCMFCEYWNPAPFPNGSMPIESTQSSHSIIAPVHVPSSQSSNSQLHLRPPSPNPEVLYEGYNLPPPPLPITSQSSVLEVNTLSVIISSTLIRPLGLTGIFVVIDSILRLWILSLFCTFPYLKGQFINH